MLGSREILRQTHLLQAGGELVGGLKLRHQIVDPGRGLGRVGTIESAKLGLQNRPLRGHRLIGARHAGLRGAQRGGGAGHRVGALGDQRRGARRDKLARRRAERRAAKFAQHRVGLRQLAKARLVGVGRGVDGAAGGDILARVGVRSGGPIGAPAWALELRGEGSVEKTLQGGCRDRRRRRIGWRKPERRLKRRVDRRFRG